MKKDVERICVVDTVYTLFLYLLISTTEEIRKTFFFFSGGIPDEVRCKFENNSFYFDRNILSYKSYSRFCLEMRFFAKFLWPFLRNKRLTYWGHSHLFYSCGIIQNNKFNLIEDGVGNYTKFNVPENIRFKWLREKIFGSFYLREKVWGMHKNCVRIYLSGLKAIDDLIKEKALIIDKKELWDDMDEEKRALIYDIYNIDKEDLKIFDDNSVVLLTQCFSEDGFCREDTKIKMYEDVVEKYCGEKKLIIKPHPREKTDYAKKITHATIYTKKIPMEIILLMGAKIRNVITVSSSFSYSLPDEVNKLILGDDFFGKYEGH